MRTAKDLSISWEEITGLEEEQAPAVDGEAASVTKIKLEDGTTVSANGSILDVVNTVFPESCTTEDFEIIPVRVVGADGQNAETTTLDDHLGIAR